MCRSLRFACPPDSRAAEREGGVAWSAEIDRDWFAHRLELDRPPADLAEVRAALGRWDAEGHPPEVARRSLCWETPIERPWPPVPQRLAPSLQLGMVRPPGPPPPPDRRLRRADEHDVDAVADAQAAEHPELGEAHRRDLRWLYRGLHARGATIWAAWDGGRPIAAATVTPGDGEARLREVWTAADRRREGLATALVAAAVRSNPELALILACEEGSDAHRIYVRAGFQPRSRFVTVSTER